MRFAALLVLALPAFAQDERAPVPKGYKMVEKFGQVRIWAPETGEMGSAAKSQFVAGVKQIVDTFNALYTMDREVVVVGREGKTVRRTQDAPVDVVAFRNREAWREWVGVESEEDDPLVQHLGELREVIGVPIEGGGFQEWVWPVLWHEFSHIYLYTDLYSGGPRWLDEGLAEYFAFQNKKITNPKEVAAFGHMARRLKERFDKKTIPPVAELLGARAVDFKRAEMDGAWVLVHLLMTESKDTLNGIIRRIAELEARTKDPKLMSSADIYRYSTWLAETAFGGKKNLQAAWEHHWSAAPDSPVTTPRVKAPIPGLKDVPAFLAIDGGGITRPRDATPGRSDDRELARTTEGTAVYGAPWKGRIEVWVHLSEPSEYDIQGEFHVVSALTDEDMKPVPLKNPKVKIGTAETRAWMVVDWQVDGGGLYRLVREYDFRK